VRTVDMEHEKGLLFVEVLSSSGDGMTPDAHRQLKEERS
jgi:hypothetical protein